MPSQIPAFRRTVALRMAGHRERIAAIIRNGRERQGIEPIDFARRIGVNPRTLERWEQGDTTPQLRHAKALSDILDRPVTDFRPDLQNEEDAVLERLGALDTKLDRIIAALGIEDTAAVHPLQQINDLAAALPELLARNARTATAKKTRPAAR